MFNWIARIVKNFRIARDFPKFEAKSRAEHAATAERRYSTADLARDVNARMIPPRIEANISFFEPIGDARQAIFCLSSAIAENQTMLSVFDRSYKDELDPLFAERKVFIEGRRALRDELSKAYEDLNNAKSTIDGWYSKSRGTFFGNGGKELPKHALFGQSFGDLDGYKLERDAASSRILRCKSEVGDLSECIQELSRKIEEIKVDRQQMFDLREQGYNKFMLEKEKRSAQSQYEELRSRLQRLENEQAEFLQAARHSTGVVSLEAEIDQITDLRVKFLQAFDTKESQVQRGLAHREAWLSRQTQ